MIDSISSSPASISLGEELNIFVKDATKKETKKLQKIEDQVAQVDARVSALGELRTKLTDLNNAVIPLNIDRLRKNSVFQEKQVLVKEDVTKNFAKISTLKDTPEQQTQIELKKIAKGEVKKATDLFSTELNQKVSEINELKDLQTITFTVHDNGLKSADLDSGWKATSSSEFFKTGTLLINGNIDVEIAENDTLFIIAEKINLACNSARVKNPHIFASVEKAESDKMYLWLRSEEKHHGVENKFTVTGDDLKDGNGLTTKNEEIKVTVTQEMILQKLLKEIKLSAIRADIVLLQEQQQGKTTVMLKSLLTGAGNKIEMKCNKENGEGILLDRWKPVQAPQDAKLSVNGRKIISASNFIETDGLKIELFGEPRKKVSFPVTVTYNSEGLFEQLKQLQTTFNAYALFAAQQSLKVIDSKTYSKPAPNAVLGREYSSTFYEINMSLNRMFAPLQDSSSYVAENQMTDMGIILTDKEVTPPSTEVNGEKVNYRPLQYSELVIDETKLKKACAEKFDKFRKVFADAFSSSNHNFAYVNNDQNVPFGAANIGQIHYDVNYDNTNLMQNLSKKVTGLKNGDIYLNGVKISVSSGDTAETLANKINRVSLATEIEAKLVSEDGQNIVKTGGNQILLTEFLDSEVAEQNYKNTPTKTKQDSLRRKLLLVDKDQVLDGIFEKTEDQPHNIIIDKNQNQNLIGSYPQITFYDTSSIVEASTYKTYDLSEVSLNSYLQPLNSADITKGGSLRIYGDGFLTDSLKGFEVLESSGKNQYTDIKFNQGVAAKISNLMNGYIKNNGFIDSSLKMERYNKKEANLQLTRSQNRYDKKMKESQRNYADILNSRRQLKNFEMLTEQLNSRNEL